MKTLIIISCTPTKLTWSENDIMESFSVLRELLNPLCTPTKFTWSNCLRIFCNSIREKVGMRGGGQVWTPSLFQKWSKKCPSRIGLFEDFLSLPPLLSKRSWIRNNFKILLIILPRNLLDPEDLESWGNWSTYKLSTEEWWDEIRYQFSYKVAHQEMLTIALCTKCSAVECSYIFDERCRVYIRF